MTTWDRDYLIRLIAELRMESETLRERASALESEAVVYEQALALADGRSEDESMQVGNVAIDDLKECKSQRDALYLIATANGGVVNATEAGKLIFRSGLSRGKQKSVISTAHRFLTDSEDWDWVGAGTFRLKSSEPTDSRQIEDDDEMGEPQNEDNI